MRNLLFSIIFTLIGSAAYGQFVELTDTVEVFGGRLTELLDKTGNTEAATVGQDFNAIWLSNFNDRQQRTVMSTALNMMEKDLQPIPFFRDYFGALVSAIQKANISGTQMDQLLDMLAQSLEAQSSRVFARDIAGLRTLFEHEALHYSANNSLFISDYQYSFEFILPEETEPEVYYPDVEEEPEEEELEWGTDDGLAEEEADPWAEDNDPWEDVNDNVDPWADEPDTGTEGPDASEQAAQSFLYEYEPSVEHTPEEGCIVRFERVDLLFSTRYDSTVLSDTKGAYLPGKSIFIGEGGKFDWSSAGLDANEVYATMDTYHFNTRNPSLSAENVKMTYAGLLDQPVKGIFDFKSTKHDEPVDAVYPRFTSYDSNIPINGLHNENLRYTGGFSLRGHKVYGASVSGADSRLVYSDANGKKFRADAQRFDFQDSLITSRNTDLTVFHGRDSIHHPSVKFRFYYGDNRMVAVKELDGYEIRAFSSSFYKMTIDADRIAWDLDADSLDISIMNAKGLLPAYFKSTEYYDEKEITELSGVYRFNPIMLVYNYGKKVRSREIFINQVVEDLKLNEKAVRAAMKQLLYLDFIEYEDISGRIYLKDKMIHYVRSKNNKKDFDDLMIPSLSPSRPNATLNTQTNDLTVRGIERFFISEMLDVYIFPDENEITLLQNRDFQFNGQLFAGNFEFVGREFTFRYDSFLVDLPEIDSIRFYVDRGDNDRVQIENKMVSASDELGQTQDFSFLQGGTSGTLFINRPDNKSGRKFFPQYPIFDASRGAIVYFDDEQTLEGAYDKSVYFIVPPFGIDSLSSSDPASIGFDGTFVSGGIFPEFDQTLRVQEDNTLGFSHVAPAEGYSLYGGAGKYYDRIELDQEGMRGQGSLDFLSGTSDSEEFIFYLDSVTAQNSAYSLRNGDLSGTSFPDILVDSANLKWLPGEETMIIENQDKFFDFYNNTASLNGTISVKPDGVYGDGTLLTRGFESNSAEFSFRENDLDARHADFELKSDTPEKPLLKGDDIFLEFDFTQNVAQLSPEIEGMAAIEFPYAQFKTSISKATWQLDEGKVYMTKPPDVPIENSYFYATREELDSLSFNAEDAVYDLASSELKISGIPYITVADAYVIPENNEVLVLENATIGELHNTTIIIDTLNEYHRLIDGTINIESRTSFTGQATYEFVNAQNDTFNIDFEEFDLWQDPLDKRATFQTVSKGTVDEDFGLMISDGMFYKGDMKMYARNKALELDGFVKLNLRGRTDYDTWIKYRSQDEFQQEVMFNFAQAISDDGSRLNAGIHHQSLSKDMYTTFVENKKLDADDDFFVPDGMLYFDPIRDKYVIEDTAKTAGNKLTGKLFAYNDVTGDLEFEGPMNIMIPEEKVQIQASGSGKGNSKSNDYSIDILGIFDYEIPDQAMVVMAADIFEVADNYGFAEAESDKDAFLYKVAEIIGERAAYEYDQRSLEDYIPIASFSSKMIGDLVFTKLDMEWSPIYNAWFSKGKLGLSNILRYDINSQLDGFIEVQKTEEKGDMVNVFIQASADSWYFFGYEDRRLILYSSNEEFNEIIRDKSNVDKAAFGEFVFVEGDMQDALTYVDRFRYDYLDIREPYEINVPMDNFEETIDIFADPELDTDDGFGVEEEEGFGVEEEEGFGIQEEETTPEVADEKMEEEPGFVEEDPVEREDVTPVMEEEKEKVSPVEETSPEVTEEQPVSKPEYDGFDDGFGEQEQQRTEPEAQPENTPGAALEEEGKKGKKNKKTKKNKTKSEESTKKPPVEKKKPEKKPEPADDEGF